MSHVDDQHEVSGVTVIDNAWGWGTPWLRISRHGARLPMRCLFTNVPVENLTTMKIHVSKSRHTVARALTSKDELLPFDLPVSPEWLARRAKMKELIGRVIFRIGLLGLACAAVVVMIPEAILVQQVKMPLFGIAGGVGLLGMIVGFIWPRLEGIEADPYSIPGGFGEDFVTITAPYLSREFLAFIRKQTAGSSSTTDTAV